MTGRLRAQYRQGERRSLPDRGGVSLWPSIVQPLSGG